MNQKIILALEKFIQEEKSKIVIPSYVKYPKIGDDPKRTMKSQFVGRIQAAEYALELIRKEWSNE